jgi:hypothetical protein
MRGREERAEEERGNTGRREGRIFFVTASECLFSPRQSVSLPPYRP